MTFYDYDADLVATVDRFVEDGLARGERVVVLPFAAHREAVDEVCLRHGGEPARPGGGGRCVAWDAADTLARFMVGDAPDAGRFTSVVDAILDAPDRGDPPVRVFGEMVSLLWVLGTVAGALRLETMWGDAVAARKFSLLCAYPTGALGRGSLTEAGRVCELHSKVVPPRSYAEGPARALPDDGLRSEVFLPIPAAVPAARHFVAAVLRDWGEDALVPDAALVTSEMATNAIVHAGSAFRIDLRREGSSINLSVEDDRPTIALPRRASPDDTGGRGLPIIAGVARRWGSERRADGKAVWVELRSRRRGGSR